MKRRFICVFLALTLGVSLLFGACDCGNDSGNDNKGNNGGGSEKPSTVEVDEGEEIKNPLSEYRIVTAKMPSSAEVYAAEELKNFIAESTGVVLPVINESAITKASKCFVIGKTAFSNGNVEYDLTKLDTDGFVIETHDESFYIVGKNGSGTLYGVYDFLERVVGVRFLTDDCTYVPKTDELTLRELRVVSNPVIEKRFYFAKSVTSDSVKYNTFLARCRMMSSNGLSDSLGGSAGFWAGGVHNIISHYIKKELYYDSHPEWFAKQGGNDDICWTNGLTPDNEIDTSMSESVFLTALETLKGYVRETPENIKYFQFGHGDFNDTEGCQCAQCKALKAKYGYSGRQLRFANKLAEEINKWSMAELGREVYVVVWAYLASADAPVKEVNQQYYPIDDSVKANDHVVIYFAPINVDRTYPITDTEHNPQACAMTSQWQAVATNFIVWDYETNFYNYMTYIPRIQTYKKNVELYSSMGAKYFQSQSTWDGNNIWYALMENYVASKVYWDPTVDANALKEEFINLYYGPGAATVMNIVSTYEEMWFNLVEENKIASRYYTELSGQIARYYGKLILRFISDLENEIAEIKADTTLTAEEKSAYADRLSAIEVTFKTLELIDYAQYHDTSLVGRYDLAVELQGLTERLGINLYREVLDFNSLLIQYLA